MFDISGIGDAFKGVREAITGEAIKDPIKQAEILNKLKEIELEYFKSQTKIIEAEAKSEHWLTSNWRPLLMLCFIIILFNNYVIVPYLTAFGFKIPTLELTEQMWDLLKLGVSGYIVGRSAEKIVDKVKDKISLN